MNWPLKEDRVKNLGDVSGPPVLMQRPRLFTPVPVIAGCFGDPGLQNILRLMQLFQAPGLGNQECIWQLPTSNAYVT